MFIKLTRYIFFRKKIKLLFFINTYLLEFMMTIHKVNIKKVGIFKKKKKFFFDWFFFLPNLDFFKEYYINSYIYEIYINFYKNKYILYFFKFFKSLEKKYLYKLN